METRAQFPPTEAQKWLMGDTSTNFTNTTQKYTVLSKSPLLKTNWGFGSYQVSCALYQLKIYFKYQNTVEKTDVKDRLALLLPSVLTYRQKHRQSGHRYFLFYTKHFSVMRLYWETSSGSTIKHFKWKSKRVITDCNFLPLWATNLPIQVSKLKLPCWSRMLLNAFLTKELRHPFRKTGNLSTRLFINVGWGSLHGEAGTKTCRLGWFSWSVSNCWSSFVMFEIDSLKSSWFALFHSSTVSEGIQPSP